MKTKILISFTATIFLFQIIFSIYYSAAIVDQNTKYNLHKELLQTLLIKQQHLEIDAAKLKSLPNLIQSISPSFPIKTTIDLSK